jgi:hypothetical protein
MSLQIQKLERLISQRPAFADIPFIVVAGQSLSPRQALQQLRSGQNVSEIVSAMMRAGYDPSFVTEEEWKLVEEYYRRLAAQPRPPVIAQIYRPSMTYAQALNEIRARSPVGQQLAKAHLALVKQIKATIG